MKPGEYFEVDKRIVERLIRSNPEHSKKVKEFIEKSKNVESNVEVINIKDLFPKRKEKKQEEGK